MSKYIATIKKHKGSSVGIIADFQVFDKENNVMFELGVINGDYEDRDDLYICPVNPNPEYEDDNLMVVYMYDVLSYEKYKELQKNVFDNQDDFEMWLNVDKDINIDLKEYMHDEMTEEIMGDKRKKNIKVKKKAVSKWNDRFFFP